ncbi:hypothetical protein PENSPDRAFT_657402 [Peniophora sp. CONT]|nr:hypothetical protein PENSPDRAFT_657402 [Peniophora sp. CONT]
MHIARLIRTHIRFPISVRIRCQCSKRTWAAHARMTAGGRACGVALSCTPVRPHLRSPSLQQSTFTYLPLAPLGWVLTESFVLSAYPSRSQPPTTLTRWNHTTVSTVAMAVSYVEFTTFMQASICT